MGRPIFPYELGDQDFSWLITTFQENHPGYVLIDAIGCPLVLIKVEAHDKALLHDDLPPELEPRKLLEK